MGVPANRPLIPFSGDDLEPLVKFANVKKTYDGETLVVKNLDLSIRQGEFLTMLGPSGSGKTTTLMMLAGFEAPTEGHIYLDGSPIHRLPPFRRNIGVVFQNYALFPHMTVEENIAFPLSVRKISKPERDDRVRRVLDMINLGTLGKRRPAQLSGGQQQRVALARALVFEPRLVLMDEPLGALDKQLRERMQIEIKQLHQRLGVTVVYVTHDQSEALTMSDRIAVFNDGAIQQLAVPSDLYERPENSFVAQFIGESNKIAGRIVSVRDAGCVVETDTGHRIHALAVKPTGPGEPTLLSIRPERVRICPRTEPAINKFRARVSQLIYLGDHIRVQVSLFGRDGFVVKTPNIQSHQPPEIGSDIDICWPATDCRALNPLQ